MRERERDNGPGAYLLGINLISSQFLCGKGRPVKLASGYLKHSIAFSILRRPDTRGTAPGYSLGIVAFYALNLRTRF